jgi:hypothetical protein
MNIAKLFFLADQYDLTTYMNRFNQLLGLKD